MKALVTGIHGQDGSYLAQYLQYLGYEVTGMTRRVEPGHQDGVSHWVYGDLRDFCSLQTAIRKADPDEIYNLGGQVFVPTSWTRPDETLDVNVGGLARILEIVEKVKPECKVYQASSSEMFGNHHGACNERTEMNPVSPYGVSKLAAHKLVKIYRQKGLKVVSGILFNHESPRRGPEMVTRKITRAVGQWRVGNWVKLELGSVTATRDWGFAGDYVKAMHKMLQQEDLDDYVIGTGKTWSISEFLATAVQEAGLFWDEVEERQVVEISERYQRQNELHKLCADTTYAQERLGWYPETSFQELVKMMVDADSPKEQYAAQSSY